MEKSLNSQVLAVTACPVEAPPKTVEEAAGRKPVKELPQSPTPSLVKLEAEPVVPAVKGAISLPVEAPPKTVEEAAGRKPVKELPQSPTPSLVKLEAEPVVPAVKGAISVPLARSPSNRSPVTS